MQNTCYCKFGLTDYENSPMPCDHMSYYANNNSLKNAYRIFKYLFIKKYFIHFHFEYFFLTLSIRGFAQKMLQARFSIGGFKYM